MTSASDPTLLRLAGIGVPPYSARGLKQTLTPIDAAAIMKRTINGVLVDLSASQFRKFQSTISGSDVAPPAVDGIWPGHTVEVDCISRISALDPGSTESNTEADDNLARTPVPGSVVREGGFITYRPRITFLVTAWSMDEDEWEAGVGWTLTLEEV